MAKKSLFGSLVKEGDKAGEGSRLVDESRADDNVPPEAPSEELAADSGSTEVAQEASDLEAILAKYGNQPGEPPKSDDQLRQEIAELEALDPFGDPSKHVYATDHYGRDVEGPKLSLDVESLSDAEIQALKTGGEGWQEAADKAFPVKSKKHQNEVEELHRKAEEKGGPDLNTIIRFKKIAIRKRANIRK